MVTIRDVSRRCGLSVSAVSKALNGYPDVSEETRARVIQAAQEMGYRPNALARGLKTRRTYNLGVILEYETHDSLLHYYFITILNGFRRAAGLLGYDITLINHNLGTEPMSFLDHCHHRNVDGICLMCFEFYAPEIAELAHSELPLVSIDHPFDGHECVISDNQAGMRALLRHVIGMGHTRIAFLHGTPSSVTDARLLAFNEVIHEHGITLPEGYVVPSHYHSTRHGREGTARLLALPQRPTCILMTDDYSALGGMEAIAQAGLRVPEDIAIVGYDGISLIQKIHPRLTTLRQDGEEIGRRAALRLIARIDDPHGPAQPPDVVAGGLIEGETVIPLA